MRRTVARVLVGAAVLCCTPLGQAENFRGPFYSSRVVIDARQKAVLDRNTKVPVDDGIVQLGEFVKFRGGRRASLVVKGDHKPIVPLTVEVFDDKGNLVARDEPGKGAPSPSARGNDYAGVVWYPPRDGYYKIRITNHGSEYNKCSLSIN